MAKIFNDLVYGDYVPTYVGMPLDRAEAVGDQLDTSYREAKDAQDQLEIMIDNLDVRDVNRPHVQAALQRAQDQLKSTRESGAWEFAGLDVKRAAKGFAMDKAIQGSLKDKKQYDAYMADLDKRFKDGTLDPQRYKEALQLAKYQNKESVSYNPNTGEYENIWSAYSPMNYVDIQKAMFEYGEKWKSSKDGVDVTYKSKDGKTVTSRVQYDPQLKGYKIVGTEEYLTEAELQSGLRGVVMSDPMYKGYIQEGLMFNKALKRNEDGTKRSIQSTDLFSANPEDNPLFNISEDKAKETIKKLGYSYEKMMADEDYREALYDILYQHKAVDGYVNPAASAYSFRNEEDKYLTDHVLLEAIKHRNSMARAKYDWQNRHKLEADKRAYEDEKNQPIIITNSSAVRPGPDYDIRTEKKAITETEGRLAQLKRELAANKDQNTGDYKNIAKEVQALERQLRTQKNSYRSKRKVYFQSPKGQAFIDRAYKRFTKDYPKGHELHMSRYEFTKHVESGDLDDKQYTTTSTRPKSGWANVGYGQGKVRTARGKRNKMVNDYANDFNNNVNSYVQENGVKGLYGEEITGDEKSTVQKTNNALNDHVWNNRTNFISSHGGEQLETLLDGAIAAAGKDGIETVTSLVSDNSDGYRYAYKIKNKKTGETYYNGHIEPASGGKDVYLNAALAGMRETKQGSDQYNMFNFIAAKAFFPDWTSDQIEDEVAVVTDFDDSSVTPVSSSLFNAGTDPQTGQPLNFKIKKGRHTYYGDGGDEIGTNTYYTLDRYNEDGVHVGSFVNPRYQQQFVDYNAILDAGVDPETGEALTPMQRNTLNNQIQECYMFGSQDDAKVGLFNTLNPNAGKRNRILKSVSTVKSERESQGTKR